MAWVCCFTRTLTHCSRSVVNVGIVAYVGRTFYLRPDLRADKRVISSVVAASLAIASLEGYATTKYAETPHGREEMRRAKEGGSIVYRYLHEHILRPKVMGGMLGLGRTLLLSHHFILTPCAVNTAVLGALGYVSYQNWDKAWDRRQVSAIVAGLAVLWGGEG